MSPNSAVNDGEKILLGIIGSKGRMGQAIHRLAKTDHGSEMQVALEVGRDFQGSFLSEAVKLDVLIDVSLPEPCEFYLKQLLGLGAQLHLPALVIASTGWTAAQLKTVEAYSKRAPVILSPNFSPGVNLFLGLLEQVSPLFKRWGYDVALSESHHTKKLDAPSGTAKALASKLEEAGLQPQINCVRAGKIVGTHTVSFVGPQDIFEIKHEALDRDLFAKGVLIASQWLATGLNSGKINSGQYSMKDVIFG